MRFIFKQLVVLILLSTMAAVAMGQTADDDEVNAAYPGYPHTFYSGHYYLTQAISRSASTPSPRASITSSSPLSETKAKIQWSYGSPEGLAAPAFWPASTKMALSLSNRSKNY